MQAWQVKGRLQLFLAVADSPVPPRLAVLAVLALTILCTGQVEPERLVRADEVAMAGRLPAAAVVDCMAVVAAVAATVLLAIM